MSESTVDDLLNLDFDPDALISLLGKLSLDNIPLDVTETLLSLENKTAQTGAADNSKYDSELSDSSSNNTSSTSVSAEEVAAPKTMNVEKEYFLSSIGLVSDSPKCQKKSRSKFRRGVIRDCAASAEPPVFHREPEPDTTLNNELGPVAFSDVIHDCAASADPFGFHHEPDPDRTRSFGQVPAAFSDDVPRLRDEEFDRVIKGLFNSFCDTSRLGERLSYPSAGPSSATFDSPFQELFNHQGKVFDIQLSDLDCSPKFDQTQLSNETSAFSEAGFFPIPPQTSTEVSGSESIHASADKFVSSPDSGYTSCSSAISPCSPPDSSESQCAFDLLDDYDEDLQSIVAAIVEVENSLRNDATIPLNACNIPILGGSEDPEDHKERILNFLKEPLFFEQSSVEQPEIKDEDSSSSETKDIFLSECKQSDFSKAKKFSAKAKEWKLGYEFKYASKSDLRHSTLFSKLKLHTEKNKILKQIQEDERALKRIKVIQLLDRKLKRTAAADDRENKRRKILCKDSS